MQNTKMHPTNNIAVALATAILLLLAAGSARAAPQVPCIFIFGDSLSDSGNNNNLMSSAKCNYPPYGVDFPGGPTGRFCNGRTTIDLVCDHMEMGYYIKPFASIDPQEMVKGVNYASGSAGILDDTGQQVGQRIPMVEQLKHHQTVIQKLTEILGQDKIGAHLSSCLYWVYAGSNDYMLNYFMFKATTMLPQQFTDQVVTKYTDQIKQLYDSGGRKFAVIGLTPLGCLPLSQETFGQCNHYVNYVLQNMYNPKLKQLVDNNNKNLNGSKFIFVDSMRIMGPNLESMGSIPVKLLPCCGIGQIWCLPFSVPCLDRKTFVYWDDAHTTEAANRILAERVYSRRDPEDAYPTDVKGLVTEP